MRFGVFMGWKATKNFVGICFTIVIVEGGHVSLHGCDQRTTLWSGFIFSSHFHVDVRNGTHISRLARQASLPADLSCQTILEHVK